MAQVFEFYGPGLLDAIGIAGFGLYVLNYTLLTFQRVRSESILYFVINGTAATMVLIGLMSAFNLAAAMIQIFFICISCVAVVVRLRERYLAKSQLQY